MASYEEIRDLDNHWVGDTIRAIDFVRDETPISICAQIRDKFGKLMHEWVAEIDAVARTVTLPQVQTRGWKVGTYDYSVKYHLAAGGKIRTFYSGSVKLVNRAPKQG